MSCRSAITPAPSPGGGASPGGGTSSGGGTTTSGGYPGTSSGGGGGGSANPSGCANGAFLENAELIGGGAATARVGAQVFGYLGEAMTGEAGIDLAVGTAIVFGGAFAAVCILGGLAVIAIAGVAIYDEYEECMNS